MLLVKRRVVYERICVFGNENLYYVEIIINCKYNFLNLILEVN